MEFALCQKLKEGSGQAGPVLLPVASSCATPASEAAYHSIYCKPTKQPLLIKSLKPSDFQSAASLQSPPPSPLPLVNSPFWSIPADGLVWHIPIFPLQIIPSNSHTPVAAALPHVLLNLAAELHHYA